MWKLSIFYLIFCFSGIAQAACERERHEYQLWSERCGNGDQLSQMQPFGILFATVTMNACRIKNEKLAILNACELHQQNIVAERERIRNVRASILEEYRNQVLEINNRFRELSTRREAEILQLIEQIPLDENAERRILEYQVELVGALDTLERQRIETLDQALRDMERASNIPFVEPPYPRPFLREITMEQAQQLQNSVHWHKFGFKPQ